MFNPDERLLLIRFPKKCEFLKNLNFELFEIQTKILEVKTPVEV